MARIVFDLATLQDPGEGAVGLSVHLLEETQAVGRSLLVGRIVQDQVGQRIVVDEAARANKMLRLPIEDRAVIAELVDVAAELVIDTDRMVERDDAPDMIAQKFRFTVRHANGVRQLVEDIEIYMAKGT